MQKSVKIAISLPKEDFEKIERFRKKTGVERSALVDEAIRFWFKHLEQENLIRMYEEGYRRKPESLKEIEAMEKLAANAFEEENLR
jgi:metal-responsive CopG/Arc/MetJ family transcriptional regulator